jgi:hypothetical protein
MISETDDTIDSDIDQSRHIMLDMIELNQILKRQTSPFHYGSKSPAVTIIVFITILEQHR